MAKDSRQKNLPSVLNRTPVGLNSKKQMNVAILLFEEFETLDVFGPVEIFGRLKDHYKVYFYSLRGGMIKNSHGISILTEDMSEIENGVDIILIPGGYGTRIEVDNIELVKKLRTTC